MNDYQNDVEVHAELEPEVEDAISDIEAKPISSQANDWTISALRDKYDRGQIDLQPHYQREYVWALKPELPSRLIESLLLQIPIPPLYFIRLETGKIEVVDGQQRLTTLIEFVTNKFELQKLQRLSSLNGKKFNELSISDQEKILDAPLRSIVMDENDNYELRYEIFERLNRGSMALTEQEIRNCAYRGPFCDMLAELELDTNWRKIRGTEYPASRFKEREMILRFFALTNRIDHYAGNLRKFLNDYMGKYAPDEPSKITELDSLFRRAMQNIYIVFGKHSARLYAFDDAGSEMSGKWEQKFSISAFDIQASALIGYSPAKIQSVAEPILEAYKFYLITNPQIQQAISSRTGATSPTKTRWFGFRSIVQEIVNDSSDISRDDPLFQPKILYRVDYFSAAGAIAGVVLERHLKDLCIKHQPNSDLQKSTINKLNDLLKKANVYDQTQARRIQVLADIRNRCDHSVPNPPSKEEVWELIEGVESLMRYYPL